MIGKTSGKLTVITFAYSKNYAKYWNCQCECGNTIIQNTGDINRKKAKSCGCSRYEFISQSISKDISGQRFGRLTAIKNTNNKMSNGNYKWLCKCDCGNEKEISGDSLRNGHTKSCGCLKIEMNMKQYENGQSRGYYHQKRLNASNQKEHKIFRKAVLRRDKYTCVLCGMKAEAGLCVHHIIPWSLNKEARTDVNNGITLCRKCHVKAHRIEYKNEIGHLLETRLGAGLAKVVLHFN